MHVPVLLQEVLTALDPQPGDFMVDGTMDGGGHAAAIIEKLGPKGKFLGVDLDEKLVKETSSRLSSLDSHLSSLSFVHGNYADLPEILHKKKLGKPDGILLDLGFSSEQLESSGRGFSFSDATRDEPLLMTYDDSVPPVRDVIRQLSEKELADVIFNLGGERRSRQIAKTIKEHLRRHEIKTVGEFADVVRSALPKGYERGRIDRATRTFQALRIYANGELENLQKILAVLPEILAPGGRAVVITFHSLEDRAVKNAFRDLSKTKTFELIYKKPVSATREEIRSNPRSRSAKLRAINSPNYHHDLHSTK